MSDTKACDLGIIQCFDFRSEFLTRDLKRVRPGIQSGENHLSADVFNVLRKFRPK